MTTEYQFQELCHKLVHQEVNHTVSNLVHTLAGSYGNRFPSEQEEMRSLVDQAWELAVPIEDWESAAFEAGWRKAHEDEGGAFWKWADPDTADGEKVVVDNWETWEDLCREEDIEPHQTEVYEHWIVSDWLAEKLKAHGERIDDDFAGMTIWARTTTGQAISMDYVIRKITKELHSIENEA
jgi:hypothetical protein